MSTLNVDKVDPSTGTDLEIGTSGDTITIPSGATLTTTSATLNLPTTITATTEVKTNKVSPATGTAFALGDSGDTFTVPSGATIVNSGTATGFGITQTSFLPTAAPLIVNGDMAVAQRATSSTGLTGSGYFTVDRMHWQNDTLGTWTQIQEAQTSGAAFEAGFATAFRVDCTTADASPAAADFLQFHYVLEGQDVQMFKKGTSNAETYTVAFWVKSNKTGTAQVNLYDDNSRICSGTYTISSGDTWEHKIVTFAADTTNAIDNDNSAGIEIGWALDAGSNYTSGTVATAWETKAATDESVENLSLGDSTSNDWAITGIQLEVGTYTSADLPPFRHESYGDNFSRCQRYFQQRGKVARIGYGAGSCHTSTVVSGCTIFFPVEMRATPSQSQSASTEFYLTGSGQNQVCQSDTLGNEGISTMGVTTSAVGTSLTVGNCYWLNTVDGDGYIEWSAEL